MIPKIKPTRVRYIKLGEGGGWEQECIAKNIIRIGFGSAQSERFAACEAARWDRLAASFVGNGKTKGTATRFTNELRLFFEDDGSILWITFVGERLYWGTVTRAKAKQSPDGDGVWRAMQGGWHCTDVNGEPWTVAAGLGLVHLGGQDWSTVSVAGGRSGRLSGGTTGSVRAI